MDRRTVDLKNTGERFVFLRPRLLKYTMFAIKEHDNKPGKLFAAGTAVTSIGEQELWQGIRS